MGTGNTSTDACRVGSNNFGKLLHDYIIKSTSPYINYQNHACSGDTTVGATRQMDEWDNPKTATLATLSIGGNVLGFSDIVRYCVITPGLFDNEEDTAKKYEAAKTAAKNLLADTTDNGLRHKLKTVYKKALDKNGRDVCILLLGGKHNE